jgi:hypothetical protein
VGYLQDRRRELSLEDKSIGISIGQSEVGIGTDRRRRPISLSVPDHPVLDFHRQYAIVLVTMTSDPISTESCDVSSVHQARAKGSILTYPDKDEDSRELVYFSRDQCWIEGRTHISKLRPDNYDLDHDTENQSTDAAPVSTVSV